MVLEQTLSLYFLRPLCTLFYKQPQKINKQAEIGLKNYTIYRTTIQIQTKVTSIFFPTLLQWSDLQHTSVAPQEELSFWKRCPSLLSSTRDKHRKQSHGSFYKVPYGAKRKFTIDKMLLLPVKVYYYKKYIVFSTYLYLPGSWRLPS